MHKTLTIVLIAALMLGLTSCGGGAASSDEGKTVAEIQTAVADMSKATIEKAIESYKSAIAAHEGDLEEIEAKIKEIGGSALEGLMGGDGAEDTKADLEKLKSQASEIAATLKALKEKMAVYVSGLANAEG